MEKIFNSKIYKDIYEFVKGLLFLIMFLYIAFICVQRLSGNNGIMGYHLYTVATGSMAGVYDVNDVIIVKSLDTSKLKVGDDVAYIGNRGGLENKLVTHRIIKIEDGENGRIFTTKGVSNQVEDPSITSSQIVGKVTGILPVVTQLNHIIKSQAGFFCLIFCPLVLVIVLEILQTITDVRLEKNELKKISNDDDDNSSDDEENNTEMSADSKSKEDDKLKIDNKSNKKDDIINKNNEDSEEEII